jgi:hypothetical protein
VTTQSSTSVLSFQQQRDFCSNRNDPSSALRACSFIRSRSYLSLFFSLQMAHQQDLNRLNLTMQERVQRAVRWKRYTTEEGHECACDNGDNSGVLCTEASGCSCAKGQQQPCMIVITMCYNTYSRFFVCADGKHCERTCPCQYSRLCVSSMWDQHTKEGRSLAVDEAKATRSKIVDALFVESIDRLIDRSIDRCMISLSIHPHSLSHTLCLQSQ